LRRIQVTSSSVAIWISTECGLTARGSLNISEDMGNRWRRLRRRVGDAARFDRTAALVRDVKEDLTRELIRNHRRLNGKVLITGASCVNL
jgi:hypothetical protein